MLPRYDLLVTRFMPHPLVIFWLLVLELDLIIIELLINSNIYEIESKYGVVEKQFDHLAP